MNPEPAFHTLIAEARSIVAFTGAGVSTECGVPDFRSPGSPWLANKPIEFQAFLQHPEQRLEAWRRKFVMDDLYADARPGRTHAALAALVASGRVTGIITQNIDGLHGASGVPPDRLVELHGNGTYAECLSCGLRHELADVRRELAATGRAPVCDCGGLVKSATISFGQPLPRAAMQRAQEWTRACDLFLVLGSSLVVQPAASLPLLAQRHGARLAIVNREATPLDTLADLVIHGDIADLLGPYGK